MQDDSQENQSKQDDNESRAATALRKLEELMRQYDERQGDIQILKEYVNIYVQNQSLSQDFFAALCEHQIILKIFDCAKSGDWLSSFESFHLLIANTNSNHNLIFIFSQPCVQTALFKSFGLQSAPESVEYYIQLLKTIILKISISEHASLVKLFCNNRYPTFPLLSNVLALAGRDSKGDILVKVTAQQCVLMLIALINKKKVGVAYLCQLDMISFFYELAKDIQSGSDRDGSIKYLIDLLEALKDNKVSVLLLMNILVHVLLIPSLNFPQIPLIFLNTLLTSIPEHLESLSTSIRSTMYLILGKYLFNRFINSTYLASQKLDLNKSAVAYNRGKQWNDHYEKCAGEILEVEEDRFIDTKLIRENWIQYNKDPRYLNAKDQKKSDKGGFFGFMRRASFAEISSNQSIRVITRSAGLEYETARPIIFLSQTLHCPSAIYIVESMMNTPHSPCKFGQKFEDTEITEIYLNENRGKFDLGLDFCEAVTRMLQMLQGKKISLQERFTNSHYFSGYSGEFRFCQHLKCYLETSLYDHLLKPNSNYPSSKQELAALFKMCKKLNLRFDKSCLQQMFVKLEQLQSEIQSMLFQNGFKDIIKYVARGRQKFYLGQSDLSEENISKSPKLKKNKVSIKKQPKNSTTEILHFKLLFYEAIKRLLDPKQPTISNILQSKWRQKYFEKGQKNVNSYKITYYQNQDNLLYLEPNVDSIGFQFTIYLYSKKIKNFDFRPDQIQQLEDEFFSVSLQADTEPIKFASKEDLHNFFGLVSATQFQFQELATMSTLEYLSSTYESLRKQFQPQIYTKSWNRESQQTPQ